MIMQQPIDHDHNDTTVSSYSRVLWHTPKWPTEQVFKHTLMKPAPSLPALFLSAIKKLPPQPASFYAPRRNLNSNRDFVARDFMNH